MTLIDKAEAALAVANVQFGYYDDASGDWRPLSGPAIISAACKAIHALPARGVGVKPDSEAQFAEWFRKNYPGPDTIIHKPDWHAPRIFRAAVAALTPTDAAPDLSDPVTVHANMLRGSIAKPTVEQIVHLYGREAFQPMIDVAIAKALEKACLAVSEHADWPEDEHGRTEQVGLFVRVINAIRAITPALSLAPTDAADELASVAAQLPGGAVMDGIKIKPLVWVDFPDRGAKAQAWNEANYMIQRWSDGRWELSASYPGYGDSIYGIDRFYSTLEAAKAAAQADYEARILAALAPTDAADELASVALNFPEAL